MYIIQVKLLSHFGIIESISIIETKAKKKKAKAKTSAVDKVKFHMAIGFSHGTKRKFTSTFNIYRSLPHRIFGFNENKFELIII